MSKYKLSDVFDVTELSAYVMENFCQWVQLFSLVTDNVFKYDNFPEYYDKFINKMKKNLTKPIYMEGAAIIISAINKVRATSHCSSIFKSFVVFFS